VYRALHRGNRPASGASEAKHIKFHTIKRIRALRSYDFGAALAVLKGIDKQSVHRLGSPVTSECVEQICLRSHREHRPNFGHRIRHVLSTSSRPIGMWRPFSKDCVPLRLWAPGVLAIDHQRTALLICYEQMLVFPVLASMLRHPSVIVGLSNTFWFDGTTVPKISGHRSAGLGEALSSPIVLGC
jgi:hypothetical protein